MKIDTHRQVETPEGLALGMRLAGLFPRAMATLIDASLRGFVYFLGLTALQSLGSLGNGFAMLLVFFGEWFYYVLFEVWWAGQTPGKRSVGLRVVHDDGTPVGWKASIIRNFLRIIDFLPILYGTAIVCVLMSSSFRRVGDWAAGTVVIYSEARPRRRRRKRPARSSAHPPDLGQVARPVPIMLSADETSALLEFRRRRASWTSERAQEICDHLAPLTGSTGAEGLDTVLAYGRWLEEGR